MQCSLTLICTGLSILISDIGLIGMMSLLYLFGRTYGWKAFVAYYFVPYVVSDIPSWKRPRLMISFFKVVQSLVWFHFCAPASFPPH